MRERDVPAPVGWQVTGVVVPGMQRGRLLGYPTANVDLTAGAVTPPDGVYAGVVTVIERAGIRYRAAISVGTNPTFAEGGRTVEAYLLDFDGDLYGCAVQVHAVRRLRGTIRFPDAEALVAAMETDVRATRAAILDAALVD